MTWPHASRPHLSLTPRDFPFPIFNAPARLHRSYRSQHFSYNPLTPIFFPLLGDIHSHNCKENKKEISIRLYMENNGNASTNANIRPWELGFYDFGSSSYSNFSCSSSSSSSSLAAQQPIQLQHYHLPQRQNHHHLTCLKLGKRPSYVEEEEAPEIHVAKRDKQLPVLPPTSIPKCQVEGCNRSLSDAKEYHRRHKVCELHSKAPRVTVQGVEQRFCQQCSRYVLWHLI